MSEMVERVARAIAAAADDTDWELYRSEARAAIEAMREPTEAMLAAVIPYPENTTVPRPTMEAATMADRLAFRSRWQDGIDAALAETS